MVDLRANLISACQDQTIQESDQSNLRAMNTQLKKLLSHWFSVGFLELEQVTWDSPCSLLQKVSDYEAVHPMRSWTDLKARLEIPFAYFDEPYDFYLFFSELAHIDGASFTPTKACLVNRSSFCTWL